MANHVAILRLALMADLVSILHLALMESSLDSLFRFVEAWLMRPRARNLLDTDKSVMHSYAEKC